MKICIIGYGNLGFHLVEALRLEGFQLQVLSHSMKELSPQHRTIPLIRKMHKINPCEVIILALSDNQINQTAQDLKDVIRFDPLVIHLSGAKNLSCIGQFENRAFLWPLQTFRKDQQLENKEFPVFIGSHKKEDLKQVKDIAHYLSQNIQIVSEQQKLALHISAVFTNNFSNLNYLLSKRILDQVEINFDVLKPIILETAKKMISQNPESTQTGPAIRKDRSTLELHRKYLGDNQADLLDYYNLCSQIIENINLQDEDH